MLRRPEPRPQPKLVDPKRFERALMGPDPNEGIPRKAIVEIRPKVLKSPTGPIRPRAPAPVVEPEVAPPPPIARTSCRCGGEGAANDKGLRHDDASPPKPDAAAPSRRSALSDATTSAAAAAVAAAKAAAAASIGIFARGTSSEAKPAQDKSPPAKAPDAASDATASDTKPAVEATSEAKPVEAKPVESTPAESKPVESKPADKSPAVAKAPIEGGDDLQRIRAIDADIERQLKETRCQLF